MRTVTRQKMPAPKPRKAAVINDKKSGENSKSKRIETWNRYVFKVFKEIHGENFRMSKRVMLIMNQLIDDVFERLALEASLLCKRHKKKTMVANDIQTAVKLLLPGELAHHAMSEGVKAVRKYEHSVDNDQRH